MTTVEDLGVKGTHDVGLSGTINGEAFAKVYEVEVNKIQRLTSPIIKQQGDRSSEPGEQALSYETIWPRSQHDWRLGTNQPYFDEDDGSRHRFADSIGVDPWGQRSLKLQHDVTQVATGGPRSTSVEKLRVVYDGSLNVYLFWMTGGVLKFDDDPASGMGSSLSHSGDDIKDFTDDGTYIYAARTTGAITQDTIGTTGTSMTSFGSFVADHVAVVHGRLIATKAGRIVEVGAAGVVAAAGQLDYTHPHAAFKWDFITDAPNGIYATGHVGSSDQTQTYFITVNPNTGGLVAPSVAVTWEQGEYIAGLAHYGGSLIAAVNRLPTAIQPYGGGFRVANINGDGSLTYGPLAPTPAANAFTGQNGITSIASSGEFMFFTWGTPQTGYHGIGRLWGHRFTETLVPAYATDLMYYDGASTAGDVQAVAIRLGIRFFVTGVGSTTNNLYVESDDYVTEGWFKTGQITYGTTERKSPVAIDWRNAPLPAGAEIEVQLAVDGGSFTSIHTYDTAGGRGPTTPVAIEGTNSGEDFELKFILRRGTDTETTPELKRWTLRSMPTPPRVDEFYIPIRLAEYSDPDDGVPGLTNFYDVLTEWQFLKDLELQGTVFTLTLGNMTESVKLDQISFQPDKWPDGTVKTFTNGTLTMKCVTVVPVSQLP